ncbi:BQ5605_C022g09420 [Microbotryum silenes-dioicae]|uniref:BQ5605_C022g09420 protein n=1 Tax=Microbotryum silenes-dioicae TaxID=796604 RepID=A0A2X0MN59_9BASI|nr:BQ5605_C022g09420 [Microbotryum silenes-dioicae]
MSRRLADPARPGITAPVHSVVESVNTTSLFAPDPSLPSHTSVEGGQSSGSGGGLTNAGVASTQAAQAGSTRRRTHTDSTRPGLLSRPSHNKRAVSTASATVDPHVALASAYSELHLAPATRTSVVTTTTTTTVHFAPILIPRTQQIQPVQSSFSAGPRRGSVGSAAPLTPSSTFAALLDSEERRAAAEAPTGSEPLRLDPKMYPLSQAPYPGGLKRFKIHVGAQKAVFYEGGEAGQTNDIGMQGEFESYDVDGTARLGRSTSTVPFVPGSVSLKGKERVTASTNSFAQSTNTPSYLSLAKTERGPLHQRRLLRRPRNSIGGHGTGGVDGLPTEDDTIEEDDEDFGGSNPPLHSESAPMHVDGEGIGPPRKRPRATSIAHQRSESVDSEAAQSHAPTPYVVPTVVTTHNSSNNNNSASTRRSSVGGQSHQLGGSLPSPNLSPPSPVPTFAEDDCQDDESEDRPESPTQAMRDSAADDATALQFDLGSGHAISGLLSLPDFVRQFDTLPSSLQSYFIFTFLKRSPIPVLQTINNIISPALRRDFLTDLPPELGVHVLGFLDARSLCRASVVCKGWRRLVDGDWRVWKQRLVRDELWIGDGSEEIEAKEIITGTRENLFLKRWRAGVWDNEAGVSAAEAWAGEDFVMYIEGLRAQIDSDEYLAASSASAARRPSQAFRLASPQSSREASPFSQGHFVHPFKKLYQRRFEARGNWMHRTPKSISFACNANNVVTCLQFDKDKIVSASDDHSIHVWNTRTGEAKAQLQGHEGEVWALQYVGNVLVSGSTDRTVRVWDLDQGRCTHTFVGHTSTVRCLQIIEPQNVNPDSSGVPIWEPPFPLIVTGSRDWSLRVWKLPTPGKDADYQPTVPQSPTEENTDPGENPYHLRHLAGHRHAVRALAAHGRIVVSGSYDCHVRVWDVMTGQSLHRLTGHTQKVYSVVYDHRRDHCASGSLDGTVRLWSTKTGQCLATLNGHSSLVGLLGLSHRNLVSAAADSTLRIWDPVTGECRHTLAAHSGAITCFQHDEYKVVSGSDGTLKMWDVRDGSFTRDLLTGLTGVWQVAFDRRFCVAAIQRNGQSEFEVLDFFPEENDDDDPEEDSHSASAGDDGMGGTKARRRSRRREQRGEGTAATTGQSMDDLIIDSEDDLDQEDDYSEGGLDGMEVGPDTTQGTGGFSAHRFPARRLDGPQGGATSDALFGAPVLDNTIVTPQNGLTLASSATNPHPNRSPSPTTSQRRSFPVMLRAEEFPRRTFGDAVVPIASLATTQTTPAASTSSNGARQIRRVASANRLHSAFSTPHNHQAAIVRAHLASGASTGPERGPEDMDVEAGEQRGRT